MTDIEKNFNGSRGDLIYGLREARTHYFNKLSLTVAEKQGMDEHWVMLDNYNNYFGVWDSDGDSWLRAQRGATLDKFAESRKNLSGAAVARGQAYHDRLLQSRYSPADVIDMDSDEMLRRTAKEKGAGFEQTVKDELAAAQRKNKSADYIDALGTQTKGYTVIRRACKFGLGLVVTEQKAAFPGAKIHFLLDGLNLSEVAAKTANSAGVPITYSELRYCFRNWDRLKGVVLFYVRGNLVKAPWEEDYDLPNIFSSAVGATDWSAPGQRGAWIQSRTVAKVSEWQAYRAHREQKHGGTVSQKDLI